MRVRGMEWLVFLLTVTMVLLGGLLLLSPLWVRWLGGSSALGAMPCPWCGGMMGGGSYWASLFVSLLIVGLLGVLVVALLALLWWRRTGHTPEEG